MATLAALEYHPDGYDTGRERLMGRHAAGEGLLKAWVRYAAPDRMIAWTQSESFLKDCETRVKAMGWDGPVVAANVLQPQALMDAGCLMLAGPGVSDAAWARRWVGDAAWSAVGITHTTATHRVMNVITEMARAPVQPWDALICTSQAVKAMVETTFDAEQAHLRDRFGAGIVVPRPNLRVIPLGVHAEDFAHQPEARVRQRAALGIPEGEPAVLVMGRLSTTAKAHPFPLYRALELAAKEAGRQVHLILAGWYADDKQEEIYKGGAAALMPSVKLHVVDGRDPVIRREIWSAPDVFALLVDNIQETFGLAPVEAMAAGLPVVVTDWDGFKDTVVHAKHGYRIPTIQAPPGAGLPFAQRHDLGLESYDAYVGGAAQAAAFDVAAAAEAFGALFRDAGLRRKLGQQGREHMVANLDWKPVIARYLDLFAELNAMRRSAIARGGLTPKAPPHRQDPFHLFAGYPTSVLTDATRLVRGPLPTPAATLLSLKGAAVNARHLPNAATLDGLAARVPEGRPILVAEVMAGVEARNRPAVLRGLAFLVKYGVLGLADRVVKP